MPALLALHKVDPRKEIMKKVSEALANIKLFGNAILVATYKRPDTAQLAGGHTLYLPDKTRDEDKYQGKVGLVLKLGPMAYVDDDQVQFHGQKVGAGDWIVYKPSDGWAITLVHNQVDCRVLTENSIRMQIESPDAVW